MTVAELIARKILVATLPTTEWVFVPSKREFHGGI